MIPSLTLPATDAFVSCLLKTGRDGCTARFDRALYQLVLVDETGETPLDLGFSGSRVLERLLQTPGEVVSRDTLLSFAWEGRVVGQGSLNQQIYTLRQALSDGRNQIIQTLPRRGYLFNPQYVLAEPPAPASADGGAPETAVIVEPSLLVTLPIEQAAPARRRMWQKLAVAGSTMSVLLGLATLGFRLASDSAPAFTQTVGVGNLEVLYVHKSQRLLDSLVKETRVLVDTMAGLNTEPARLIVNRSPGFYEIRCLQDDGRVNWLKVHRSQLQAVSSDHLQGCLQ